MTETGGERNGGHNNLYQNGVEEETLFVYKKQ